MLHKCTHSPIARFLQCFLITKFLKRIPFCHCATLKIHFGQLRLLPHRLERGSARYARFNGSFIITEASWIASSSISEKSYQQWLEPAEDNIYIDLVSGLHGGSNLSVQSDGLKALTPRSHPGLQLASLASWWCWSQASCHPQWLDDVCTLKARFALDTQHPQTHLETLILGFSQGWVESVLSQRFKCMCHT